MKKYGMFALIFVLTAAMLVGCGCTNRDATVPTVLPTNEEVLPTTRPTTQPTTQATTEPTSLPTETNETIDRGNGALEDTATETTGEPGSNARGIIGGGNGSAGKGTAGGIMGSGGLR